MEKKNLIQGFHVFMKISVKKIKAIFVFSSTKAFAINIGL